MHRIEALVAKTQMLTWIAMSLSGLATIHRVDCVSSNFFRDD